MKLKGSVYGFSVAPRRWRFRVFKDLISKSWRLHQLGPCLYMKYYWKGEFIGVCGVYVDDFIMGFSPYKDGQAAKSELKSLYSWRSGDTRHSSLVVFNIHNAPITLLIWARKSTLTQISLRQPEGSQKLFKTNLIHQMSRPSVVWAEEFSG